MTISALLSMLFCFGFVVGGFIFFLLKAISIEKEKSLPAEQASTGAKQDF
jgi:hypothetical protein